MTICNNSKYIIYTNTNGEFIIGTPTQERIVIYPLGGKAKWIAKEIYSHDKLTETDKIELLYLLMDSNI